MTDQEMDGIGQNQGPEGGIFYGADPFVRKAIKAGVILKPLPIEEFIKLRGPYFAFSLPCESPLRADKTEIFPNCHDRVRTPGCINSAMDLLRFAKKERMFHLFSDLVTTDFELLRFQINTVCRRIGNDVGYYEIVWFNQPSGPIGWWQPDLRGPYTSLETYLMSGYQSQYQNANPQEREGLWNPKIKR